MTYKNRFSALRALSASVLVALVGLAAFAAPAAAELPLTLTVGGKFGVGANYLSAPPPISNGLIRPFDDGAGGYGLGGGVFAEARLLEGLVGVELGVIFDSSSNWSQFDVGAIEYEPGWSALDMRMPLLVNVGLPGVGTRVAIGTGPEFVFPLSASGSIGDTPGSQNYIPNAEGQTHVNWLVNLGLAVPVGPVRASFDLRFAYNLGTPTTYAERYNPTSLNLVAVHEMDIRLILGVGYDILAP